MSQFISEYSDVIVETICATIIIGFFLMLIKETGAINLLYKMLENFLNGVA